MPCGATLPSSGKNVAKHPDHKVSKEEKCKFSWALRQFSGSERSHRRTIFTHESPLKQWNGTGKQYDYQDLLLTQRLALC